MLRKISHFALIIAIWFMGIGMFSASASVGEVTYTQLKLDKTITRASYEYDGENGNVANTPKTTTLVVEGKNESGEWVTLANSDPALNFKSLFPTATVSQLGVVTPMTTGTAQIVVIYVNPDGSFIEKSISIITTHYDTSSVIKGYDFEAESGINAGDETEIVHRGSKSLNSKNLAADWTQYPNNQFGGALVEMWFYDNLTTRKGGVKASNAGTSNGRLWNVIVGVDTDISQDHYFIKDIHPDNSNPYFYGQATVAKRTEGWHQVVIDSTRYGKTYIFIDGICIYKLNVASDPATVATVGNGMIIFGALATTPLSTSSVMYYDDFFAYKATDGRPIVYNVEIENVLLNTHLKQTGVEYKFSYEYLSPMRVEEGASEYRIREAYSNWPYLVEWSVVPQNPIIYTSTTKNGLFFGIKPKNTTGNIDYSTGQEVRTPTSVNLANVGAGLLAETRFYGETDGHFRNISAEGLAGEKSVKVCRRVLNNTISGYQETVLAAVYENGTLSSVEILPQINAEAGEFKEVSAILPISDSLNTVIKVFKWEDTGTIKPLGTSTEFDALGIK